MCTFTDVQEMCKRKTFQDLQEGTLCVYSVDYLAEIRQEQIIKIHTWIWVTCRNRKISAPRKIQTKLPGMVQWASLQPHSLSLINSCPTFYKLLIIVLNCYSLLLHLILSPLDHFRLCLDKNLDIETVPCPSKKCSSPIFSGKSFLSPALNE